MLKITIELVPGGRKELAEVIGRGYIANVSNLADLSNYACRFEENPWQGRIYGPYLGTLSDWPRNDKGAWEIVHAALGKLLSGGNSDATHRKSARSPSRNSRSLKPRGEPG